MLKQIKLVAVSILALLTLIAVLQNTGAVETKVLFFSGSMPLAALIFVALAVGFSTGVLVANRLTARRTKKSDETT